MRSFLAVLIALAAAQPAPAPGMAPRTIEGRQLSVTTSQSDLAAAPGTALWLLLDVVPKPKMHVYAPEQQGGYIRVELDIDEQPALRIAKPVFPKASDYYFEPLKETFKVFDKAFRIRQNVRVAPTAARRRRASPRETLTITGTLRYQACDDQVCYRPDEVKVSWEVLLQPPGPR